jgi:Glycosyl transferases group 1
MMRLLFVGESWLGSCARSLKEALARSPGVRLDEVNEDLFLPKPGARWLRAVNRILLPAYRREFYRQILYRSAAFKPDIVMTYKGGQIRFEFVHRLQALGYKVVNVYPDYSPHAYGAVHKKAVGAYDLVISTKPFHPALWQSVYGYKNRCVFVAQGYDPLLHLVTDPPRAQRFDVVLVATWRPEYGALMKTLGELLRGRGVSMGIGGNGWMAHREDFPSDWVLAGALTGRAYVDWLREGRICLAPVTREVVIAGVRQPGDEDSTRTYELAAAHCFFIHRRTGFVQRLYDEATEVPMYDTAAELAEKIMFFLPRADERAQMAAMAHARAVPAYSIDAQAEQIVTLNRTQVSL